jgi:uncharacterized membrane protein YeaQ/YmgE (transglycosylase-associated protein family)
LQLFTSSSTAGEEISTSLTAIVGSIVLLVIYRVVTGNTRRGLHV